MIHLLGGSKTAYNLYKKLNSCDLIVQYYAFENEYAENKKTANSFANDWKGMVNITKDDQVIVTSETAYSHLSNDDKKFFKFHFYLREKKNIKEIAKKTGVYSINELEANDRLQFPVIIKPNISDKNIVDFKFKVIKNYEELINYQKSLKYCLIQPYLDEKKWSQYAIAGYFTGVQESLITVQQMNQFPVGVSSYVKKQSKKLMDTKSRITEYLNYHNYRGFIEFEFKVSIKNEKLIYLMDINPRPWGWSSYLIENTLNWEHVLFEGENPNYSLKGNWVNFPRLVVSNLKNKINFPSIYSLLFNTNYEPYFYKR